jgi:hypothetical protein
VRLIALGMSRPFDHGMNMPMPNMLDQPYPVYDGSFNAAYPRLSGPPTHFDGVAFWYNPTPTEPLYDRESNMFNARGIAMPGAGMESTSVKHRRTRSGCFTCRSRRVKVGNFSNSSVACLANRSHSAMKLVPSVTVRVFLWLHDCHPANCHSGCKKGGRECEFPPTTSSSKRSKHAEGRNGKEHHGKNGPKEDHITELPTIQDESEDDDEAPISPITRRPTAPVRSNSAHSVAQSTASKNTPEPTSTVKESASPHSSDISGSASRDDTPASSLAPFTNSAELQARQTKIKSLKPDVQKYLQFQQDYMTFYHYFFKLDPMDFVHCEFIDLALSFEPLLYAVVGFAAYHYEWQQPDPQLSHFLGYHSRSLSMLRRSLEKGGKVTEATLLTVLQLSTFDEYIGDWVNLVGHHRAALAMVHEIYTPEGMMETELGRRIFSWIARLDVMVGLMGGTKTRLDRSWFEANAKWYGGQVDPDPNNDVDIGNTLAYFVAANRLIGMDVASLFARFAQREMSVEDFRQQNEEISSRISKMRGQIQILNDDYYRVQEFPVEKSRPLTPDDIVNPYVPGGLFKGALWPLNFMWMDWYSIEQLQISQSAGMLQQPLPPSVEHISLEQCRIYEATERWPDAPAGATLGAHGCLGLASVFMKKDIRHVMWLRRKFASIERQGYIFPPSFRHRMAQMWGLTVAAVGEDEAVENWWLPNDEGNVQMLKEIRRVVQERYESDAELGVDLNAGVRDIKAIFEKLDIRTQSAKPPDDFSPLSDTSGGTTTTEEPASIAGFSPTSVSFTDASKAASTGGETQTQKRRGTRSGSRP